MKNGKGKIILLLIISIISINKVNAATLGINSATYTNNGTNWSNLPYWSADNRYDFNPYNMISIRLNMNLTSCSSEGQYNFTFYTDPSYSLQSNMVDTTTLNGVSCNVSVTQTGNAYVSCPNVPSSSSYQLQFRPYTLPQSFTMGIVKEYSVTCGFDSNSIINNNNTNTNNIINNNNNNTQEIIDNQTELLGEKCQNLFNKSNYAIDSHSKLYFDLSQLETGKTYRISSNKNVFVYKFARGNNQDAGSYAGPQTWTNGIITWTFTATDNKRLFLNVTDRSANNFVTNINQLDDFKFMLTEGTEIVPYCEYGSVKSKLDTTNSAINDNTQAINDMTNADYNGPTEQPDTTNYDSYKQKEETLENISEADMSSVNVGLDYDTSNWLWNLVNRIVNVNPIIMSFYITILSIGVIKLIMRR